MNNETVINAVKYWLEQTIIGFNFCPFAKKELLNKTIHYEVVDERDTEEQLMALTHEFERLDKNLDVKTTLFVLPIGLESFFDYLDFLEIANELVVDLGYEGQYQLASFHPDYCFENVQQNDPSNYTNRSPFPIVHILRESSLERVLAHYPDPGGIPLRNIEVAKENGGEVFRRILERCNDIVE